MMHQWLDMIYNQEREHWEVIMNEKEYAIHCGECFEIYLGNHQSHICRLEFDKDWYVIMGEVAFQLRAKQTYWIVI